MILSQIRKLPNLRKYENMKICLCLRIPLLSQKVALKKIKTFGDLFTNCIEHVTSTCKAERYDYIYGSYLESSLKEVEQICRKKDCEPLEFHSFTMLTPLPHQTERFWDSNKSKELLEILS